MLLVNLKMQIYFILGLAMVIVVLWDYKNLPETAKKLTKQSPDKEGSFSRIAVEIRNWAVMITFAFFLWPLVILIELTAKRDK
jgi:hypothetical protein